MQAISRTERRAIAEAVSQLPDDDHNIDDYAPKVIAIFDGMDAFAFRAIDDAIGNAAPEFRTHGYMVRRVRNHPTWGRKLFAALK